MRKIEKNRAPKKTSDALAILNRMTGKSSKMHALVAKARINAAVSQLIYDAREKARLTQKELADLIGTNQPVIARLEDADYEGHSLTMLQRIATALNQRLQINLTPLPEKKVA